MLTLTPLSIALLILGSGALLLVLLALFRRFVRRKAVPKRPRAQRSVVYLISGMHLLVMQRELRGRLRPRLEVPKGKVMDGETTLAAAHRECREESGLRPGDLQLFTSIQTRQRNGRERATETWDAFWGRVPADTPIPFKHRVRGKGGDRGRVYHYHLVLLETAALHPPLDEPLPALRRALAEALSARGSSELSQS